MDDIAFVESHRTEYPELDLIQVRQRLYPKHAIAAAMLGYVGEVSEEDIAKAGSPYRPGDVVGKSGIEKEYNSILMGRAGMRRVVVNSRGQEQGEMETLNANPVTGLATWARELACPVCFSALRATADKLTCTACHRTYPITNGIPILIPDRIASDQFS